MTYEQMASEASAAQPGSARRQTRVLRLPDYRCIHIYATLYLTGICPFHLAHMFPSVIKVAMKWLTLTRLVVPALTTILDKPVIAFTSKLNNPMSPGSSFDRGLIITEALEAVIIELEKKLLLTSLKVSTYDLRYYFH